MRKTLPYFPSILIILLSIISIGMWETFKLKKSEILIRKEIIFTLKANTGRLMLSKQLYNERIINHPHIFQWLLRLEPTLSHFNAGTYRFMPGMSVYELLKLMKKGKEAQFALRFIEGMRLSNYLKKLRRAIYIQHTLEDDSYETVAKALDLKHPSQIEGHFWPDTWLYTANTKDIFILRRAFNEMTTQIEKFWQHRAAGLPYKNRNQFITMASIIEKETAVLHERSKVASVFINRLRIGMRLQADSTVIYGMGIKFNGRISRQDLKTPTVYNTYVEYGLPPGPIATPSKTSLDAAAHPAKTPYLYFVANGTGGHVFNIDLDSHNRSVEKYLRILKEKNIR